MGWTGWGSTLNVVEVVVPAVERCGIVRPDEPHDVDRLVETCTASAEVLPERGELGRRPASTDRHSQPTGTEPVEAGQAVGELQRVVLGHDQHARAQTDVLCRRRRPGQRQQRVEQVGRRVALTGRLDDVIADPDVDETELLGTHRHAADRVG